MPNRRTWIGLLLCLVFLECILWVLVSDISQFFEQKNGVVMPWVENYWPSFYKKLLDYPSEKILSRLWQMPWRLAFVYGVSVLIFFRFRYLSQHQTILQDTHLPTWAIRAFYATLLFLVRDWGNLLQQQEGYSAFYQPTFFYAFFTKYPPWWFFEVLWWLVVAGVFLMLLGIGKFKTGFLLALLLFFMQGFFWCFGKTDHLYAPLLLMAFVMPLHFLQGVSLTQISLLISVAACWPYGLAGLEKCFHSGLMWQLRGFSGLTKNFGVVLVMFQLSGFIASFWRFYARFFWLLALCFHSLAFLYLAVGHFIHPWWLMAAVWALYQPKTKKLRHV
ncbi:MAG: hypothetical protein EAZ57_05075 [Cytophagales bacterium]|nr:MAG: hypothetical protein EAZ67_00805 [Cytophagales bacterium]TAF61161.1 MAG: hypothetical protein EAZ57_05075 [Cytophagales bacterium]